MSSTWSDRGDQTTAGADVDADNLSLQSSPWTEAHNAAGFVLRYLIPMRDQLIQGLGSESLADECLRRIITHLVAQGFGSHARGRLRDFLLRATRSAAKTLVAEQAASPPAAGAPLQIDWSQWMVDTQSWRDHWRAAVLARAWRTLERREHQDRSTPLYSILRWSSAYPRETPKMLAIRINTESDVSVDAATITRLLPLARRRFAQILLGEIVETLDEKDAAAVEAELAAIGLADAVAKLRNG